MLKASLLLLATFPFISAIGQNKRSIEFSLIGRYDQHADYVTNFHGRSYNDTLTLYGLSYGTDITYRQKITESISASLGIGYYRRGIDKIKSSTPFAIGRTKTTRETDYDDGVTRLLYSTSKYHYDNFSITIGLNKTTSLKNKLNIDFGAECIGYYSFSQCYEINIGDGITSYSTNNVKPLEFGVNATIGILKEYNKFYIRPAFLIPIYQNLKGDKVFYEDKKMNISKWFNGIGVTLRIGKYL